VYKEQLSQGGESGWRVMASGWKESIRSGTKINKITPIKTGSFLIGAIFYFPPF
jgi:hypothetical protein